MISLSASTKESFGSSEGFWLFVAALLAIALIYGLMVLTRRAHVLLDKELKDAEAKLKEEKS